MNKIHVTPEMAAAIYDMRSRGGMWQDICPVIGIGKDPVRRWRRGQTEPLLSVQIFGVTPEIATAIRKMRTRSKTWASIITATGIGRDSLRRWRREQVESPLSIRVSGISAEAAATIHEMRARRQPWREIYARIGRSRNTVAKWRRQTAFVSPPITKVEFTAEIVTEITRLRLLRQNWEIVAERIGVDGKTLRNWRAQQSVSEWLRPLPWPRIAAPRPDGLERDALNPPPGESLAAIGRRYGVGKNVISGIRAHRR